MKYLDGDDIVMDYSDNQLLDKIDEIEKEKEEIENFKNMLKFGKKKLKLMRI